MNLPPNSKCYIDQTNQAYNQCHDCGKPICGLHSVEQSRYVDRYTTGASFIVCPTCFEIYKEKNRVRTPLMIIVAIGMIIITFLIFSTRFNGFLSGFP